jgi:tRNA dimethylallyltransferase
MSKPNPPDDVTARRGPVALIAGPTASGKSDMAVDLAQALARRGASAVVINADSAQVYRDLAVLSARPTEQDMGGIEHRLFGTWDGADPCSAADWAAAAKAEIAACHAAGQVPILVGGTGLYMRTLLDGIAPVPPIDEAVRSEVRALPTASAWTALQAEDPDRAALLNPRDSLRIARALEVVRSTGRPLVHWQARRVGGISGSIALLPLVLLPAREALYRRCDMRFERMMPAGAIGEVEALLARRLPPLAPVMRAIGVPEIAGFLRGEWSLDEAISKGKIATRNYAKRQYTWFRNQPSAEWTRLEPNDYPDRDIFETLFLHLGLT